MTPPQAKKATPFPGTVTKRIRERPVQGLPLGRHVNHDPRSLGYQVKPRAALAVTTRWRRVVPVFDQGALGSCTGNAAVGALGSAPYFDTLTAQLATGLVLDEAQAVRIYSAATALDPYPGAYPPKDTGSDGLSVAKAAKAAGLIAGYLHCTSLDAVITALQSGPVITGVTWYDSFDAPDSAGLVGISAAAQPRGGHEFELYGVDMEQRLLHAYNSWGAGWGDAGAFAVSFDDYARLLGEDGDATQFVPITAPAPAPRPVTPNAADVAFAAAVGVGCARTRPFKTWKAALGL